MKWIDKILETVVAAAIVVLCASLGLWVFGCSSEPAPTVERVPLMLNGKPHMPIRDMDHARLELESQRDDGWGADARLLAMKRRSYVFGNDGMYMGPPASVEDAARDLRMYGPAPKSQAVRFADEGVPIVFGTDDRDWPTANPPAGSYASLAYRVDFPTGTVITNPEGTLPSCGATQVVGNYGQSVAVTSAHCMWPRQRGIHELLRFRKGWTLPHNAIRTPQFWGCDYLNECQPFTCIPLHFIPAGWINYQDELFDLVVMNWTANGCEFQDIERHQYALPWRASSYQPNTSCGPFAPGSCTPPATEWLWVQNWGPPRETVCGQRPGLAWPTSCGHQSWAWRWSNDGYARSSTLDVSSGQSGSGWFTLAGSSTGNALIGVHQGWEYCPWCTDQARAVTRNIWNGPWIATTGVQ